MNSSNHIEVKITQKNAQFTATSESFPKCKGIGQTSEEALEKLSKSIARHIASMLSKSLNETLTSNRYTELIFDSTQDPQSEKRVFQLAPEISDLHQNIILNLKPIEVPTMTAPSPEIAAPQLKQHTYEMDDIDFLVSTLDDIVSDITATKSNSSPLSEKLSDRKNQIKGFGFGFPLSFN